MDIHIDDPEKTLDNYVEKTQRPPVKFYDLSAAEAIFLQAISADRNLFVGSSPNEMAVTGVESIDQRYIETLISKRALLYTPELPEEIKGADLLLFDTIIYSKLKLRCKHRKVISTGVFKNTMSDNSALNYRLAYKEYSIEDAKKVREIVRDVQIRKLQQLVQLTSDDHKIIVDDSKVLRSRLQYLAKNYRPDKLAFTFNAIAYKVKKSKNAPWATKAAAKHQFAYKVEAHIEYVKKNNLTLLRSSRLSPFIEISPFEKIFSKKYLRGYSDWNKLSTNEVVAMWLEKHAIAT